MSEIFTETEPNYDEIFQDLKADVGEYKTEILEFVVSDAAIQMRDSMNSGTPSGKQYARPGRVHTASSKGEVPAIDSSELFYSIKGDKDTITMAEHAFYLDPIFEDEGGGDLDRPFISDAIDESLIKAFDKV